MSNTGTRYDVCLPRKYRDGSGNERTHFWSVGTGFGFERPNQQGGTTEGVSVKLYAKMLITDEYVLFKREPEAPSSEPPPDDNVPF